MGGGKRRDEEDEEEGDEERGHVDWRERRATWQSPGPWTLWRGIRD
jgi:hypothetical protein